MPMLKLNPTSVTGRPPRSLPPRSLPPRPPCPPPPHPSCSLPTAPPRTAGRRPGQRGRLPQERRQLHRPRRAALPRRRRRCGQLGRHQCQRRQGHGQRQGRARLRKATRTEPSHPSLFRPACAHQQPSTKEKAECTPFRHATLRWKRVPTYELSAFYILLRAPPL